MCKSITLLFCFVFAVVSNHTRGKYSKYRADRDLIESNISHSTSQMVAEVSPAVSDRISASIHREQQQSISTNPFGEDDEDESTVIACTTESTNPFGDDYDEEEEEEEENADDYDKNLNPFA